jgi:hypothetical protein
MTLQAPWGVVKAGWLHMGMTAVRGGRSPIPVVGAARLAVVAEGVVILLAGEQAGESVAAAVAAELVTTAVEVGSGVAVAGVILAAQAGSVEEAAAWRS